MIKLIDKELAILEEIKLKWINKIGNTPLDEEKVRAGVEWLYNASGLETPTVLFAKSPKQAIKMANDVCHTTDKHYSFAAYGGIYDYSWLAFYDFFDTVRAEFDNHSYLKYKEFIEAGVFHTIQLATHCIVVGHPTKINITKGFRLHNELPAPALVWPDGTAQYFVNDLHIPAKYIESPETLTVEAIQRESNQEVRRIMIERFGVSKYLIAIQAKLLDVDIKRAARALIEDDKKCKWLVCSDGSTRRTYHLFVGKERVNTCKEAHELLCRFSEDLVKVEG